MPRLYFAYKGRINRQLFFDALVMISLFLAFLNFVTRNYYCLFIAFALFVITPKRAILVNRSTIFLLIFGFSILLFDSSSRNSVTNYFKPFVFFMAYTIGTGLVSGTEGIRTDDRHIEKAIYLCTFGFLTHYLLNFISNIGSMQRNTVDFWTKTVLSATGQASLATMSVAVIAAVLFSKRSKRQKVIAAAVAFVAVGYNLILAGRTLLYMLAIAVGIAFLYSSIVNKTKIFSIVLKICVIVAAIVLSYKFNIFSIRTAIEDSNLYQRMLVRNGLGIADDLRFDYKMFYLKHLLDYPFGGGHIRVLCMHYAHDLYLDSYDQYGVITFLAIVAYVISTLFRLFRSLRSSSVSFNVKQLVLCTYMVLNIQFWIEPIMDGMPFLLVAYCFIDGILTRFLSTKLGVSNSHKESV